MVLSFARKGERAEREREGKIKRENIGFWTILDPNNYRSPSILKQSYVGYLSQ